MVKVLDAVKYQASFQVHLYGQISNHVICALFISIYKHWVRGCSL